MQFYRRHACKLLMLLCPLTFPHSSIVAQLCRPGESAQKSQDVPALEKLAMDYCCRLANAGDPEGYDILLQLQSDPGRSIKLPTAVRSLGRLNDRFDWWLLSYVNEKNFDSDWIGPLNQELSERPQLSKRLLWASRTSGVMHAEPDENWANWYIQALLKDVQGEQEMLEISANLQRLAAEGDDQAKGFLLGDCVWLHLAWAACGWPDAAKGVTPDNWPARYRHFRDWWQKYGPFLQFDPKLGYFVLDRQAMSSGKPLPDQARRIPKAPLPEWLYTESEQGHRKGTKQGCQTKQRTLKKGMRLASGKAWERRTRCRKQIGNLSLEPCG